MRLIMGIFDRDWYRDHFYKGSHSPTCTCVGCVSRRSGHREGRRVWRGNDLDIMRGRSAREVRNDIHRTLRWRRFRKILAYTLIILLVASLWIFVFTDVSRGDILEVRETVLESYDSIKHDIIDKIKDISSNGETDITESEVREPLRQETQACAEYAAARHEILYQLVEQQVQGSSKVNRELDRLRKTFDGNPETLCNLKPESEYVAEVIRIQKESSRRFREGLEKQREETIRRQKDIDKLCEKLIEFRYRLSRKEEYSTLKRLQDEINKEAERLELSSIWSGAASRCD